MEVKIYENSKNMKIKKTCNKERKENVISIETEYTGIEEIPVRMPNVKTELKTDVPVIDGNAFTHFLEN